MIRTETGKYTSVWAVPVAGLQQDDPMGREKGDRDMKYLHDY